MSSRKIQPPVSDKSERMRGKDLYSPNATAFAKIYYDQFRCCAHESAVTKRIIKQRKYLVFLFSDWWLVYTIIFFPKLLIKVCDKHGKNHAM